MVHPPVDASRSGMLEVSGGDQIYWETSGNPRGRPVLYLHGGPGSGLGPGSYRRRADPARHLIIGVDQRGCGRSRPLASDALERLPRNTTRTLIGDLEALRDHLGVDRWLVQGVSWGSTLALAYAQAHPGRVTEMVLAAVTTTSRAEVAWITEGVRCFFPEAWQRFDTASQRRPGEPIVAAYARRLAGSDATDRVRAANAWDEWESVHASLDPQHRPGARHPGLAERMVFATLVTHYWAHDGFLAGDAAILGHVDRIAHIPAVLIHGRRDISGPVITAWRLHRQWPASTLFVVEDEGHGGTASMDEMCRATDAFAVPTA